MARYCSLGGAAYAPSELRECYLALCAEETAALAKKSGLGEDEVEIELRHVFRRLYAEKGVRVSAARLDDTAIAFRALSYTSTPRLMPGARRTLDGLRQRGARLFLLSNAQSCFTVPELRLLGLSKSFDQIFLSSDFGCKKPSAAFFHAAMAAAGVTAEEIVMVGNDPDNHLTSLIRASLLEHIPDSKTVFPPDDPKCYLTCIAMTGVWETIIQWMYDGMQVPPDELAAFLSNVYFYGGRTVLLGDVE